MLQELENELENHKNPEKAKIYQRFFKTGPGEYGEGDIFLGLTSAQIKEVAKNFRHLNTRDIQNLINSKIHEHRVAALRILILQYQKAAKEKNETRKKEIYRFYLKNAKQINNWDLVDISSPNVVGNYLLNKERSILYSLAKSENLWEKRISIVSTLAFIRNGEHEDTIKISEILLKDRHDLIHKAVGWMLREMGKRKEDELIKFLNKNYKLMPRTMLRYAIEKLDEKRRQAYLKGEI
jgi:3-methyladenine DNA glycosylase AlkD